MKNKSNSSRTIVNLIGIPFLLTCIFLGDDSIITIPVFSILVFIIMILSTVEWNSLTETQYKHIKNLNFVSICGLFLTLYNFKSTSFVAIVIVIHLLIGSLMSTICVTKKPLKTLSNSIFGVVFIGVCIGSLILIRNLDIGLNITYMMFISIWTCDTFAFFFGKKYGRKKLSPSLSPNKTWFGAMSGTIGSMFIVLIFYTFIPISNFNILDYIVFGLIFGVLGQIGDLLESSFKRERNIKDTSNILQGHGGLLDRFDSLSFASPVLYLYLLLRYIV